MAFEADVSRVSGGPADGHQDVKSDVAIVPRNDGASLVAFHLEDGQGTMSCLLTQAQAEALSNELIKAADKARFFDATRPRGAVARRLLA